MYEVYESPEVVTLSAAAGGSVGATASQVLTLPRVERNPVLFGQVHSGMQGQVLVRINDGPQMEITPNSQSAKNSSCHFGAWRSFRVQLDAHQLRVGDNVVQWTVGPRPACASGQWWWDGFNVKGLEIQLDP
jgi:hypothetical protein